ncbi:MAG TPA: hypothetical protein PLR50_07235, partial [Candidatus Rifleibacterium sp.]|nr:hypothetical protein [Candidatus Rifleibacterium sp.]
MENSENNINQTTEEIVETHEQQPVAEPPEEASFELLCAALDGLLLVQNKPISIEKLAAVLS